MLNIAVVGAGPYGLSIAAHLRARGVEHRIFGAPMQSWRNLMPKGMLLKSEGFASNLSEPTGEMTLERYCSDEGVPFARIGRPVSLETFADYGEAFQRRLAPHLEPVDVTELERVGRHFRLNLANGKSLEARRVVLAIGITHFARMPSQLAPLSPALASHSSRHADLSAFAGREVIVLGAGASAVDTAVLLEQAGASAQIVARTSTVRFGREPSPEPRPLLERMRAPMSGVGPGWSGRLCTDAPLLFHFMPERFRIMVTRRSLGPAPGWWTRPLVEGKVKFHLGQTLLGAKEQGGRIRVELAAGDGARSTLAADHLIAATGYHPDVQRLGFLSQALRAQIRVAADAPVLSRNFESSVDGLYFVGLCAANSFGPVSRFVFGADFTARRLARHLDDRPVSVASSAAPAKPSPLSA